MILLSCKLNLALIPVKNPLVIASMVITIGGIDNADIDARTVEISIEVTVVPTYIILIIFLHLENQAAQKISVGNKPIRVSLVRWRYTQNFRENQNKYWTYVSLVLLIQTLKLCQFGGFTKLIPNLYSKEKYVIHER